MVEETDFPRVLFVTPCAFNRETGGGITFGNLFAGWPKDRLATVHNDPVPVTRDVCEKYFRLTNNEIRRWISKPGRRISDASGANPSVLTDSTSTHILRAAKFAKGLVFGNGLPERGVISERLENWIRDFQPDLMYSILGSNGILELVGEIQKSFRLPLAIHMMDDWPSTIYRGGVLSVFQRRAMMRMVSELMQKATSRIAICDLMARVFEKRYGVPFVAYQNAVDLTRWANFVKADMTVGDTLRILYVGSILEFAQRYSLVDCCRAVAELSAEGRSVELEIYSPDAADKLIRRELEIHDSITIKGSISDDERFFQTLSDADLLVLPVNFDRRSVSYIRYSMPTKVPAYLASGTPILVYGPMSVAQVEYASREHWGEVVSQQGVQNVKKAILALLGDRERRTQLSIAARRAAQANHDKKAVCTAFQQTLFAARAGRGPLSETSGGSWQSA